ncbi:hypothetical protein [Burkholderia gladioli]|uniref:hypothetical protein n=1 Tax=Burkholderia gladioli TaxID=28095 RepID=UPI00163EF8A1|nr:hypothetical protein [Burkholderia gladioli]
MENKGAVAEAGSAPQRYRCQRWVRACNAKSSRFAGFAKHLREIVRPTQIAYQQIMSAYDGQPVCVEIKHHDREAWSFVLPNVYGDRPWRIQHFDHDGFSGHECHDSLEAAVEDMIGLGYRIMDAGALDRIAATLRWHLGVRRAAILQKSQEGLITFEQMLAEQAALAP